MTLPALASAFGVARSTVHHAIREGHLPAFRLGSMYRIYPSKVPDFLAERWRGAAVEADREMPTGPIVYFIGGPPGYVKIGYTSDVARRICEIQPGSPYALELLAYAPNGSVAAERQYHRRFHNHRVSGEWFERAPAIEAEIASLLNQSLAPPPG